MKKSKITKIVKRKINFVRMPLQNTLLKSSYRNAQDYRNFYENTSVKENTILYESRDGKSITDNPYAIFKFLLNNQEYSHFSHIWSVQSKEDLSKVISQYENIKNVSFVVRNSKEYLKVLATSKYLINNATFQPFVIPKEEQIYINTWHGTPLKKMGFNIPGNPSGSKNVVRNFLSADYLISPNSHTTEMYTNSYKMSGLYSGSIIEDGYPRNDLILNTDKDYFENVIRVSGLAIDNNKSNVLYAPTWKGQNLTSAKDDMNQIISDMNLLKKDIGDNYNIFIKVHPFLYDTAKKYDEIKDMLIPDFFDTNELLSIVDVLITDYSSIFFDFLVTGKPILFYVWDAESYTKERGSYFSLNELPGPTLYTTSELIKAFGDIDELKKENFKKYEFFQKTFVPYDDGNVTKRLVNRVFNDKKSNIKVISNLDKEKEKILFYAGGMMNNGITSSFLNLMDNIDYNKYDVSVFMNVSNKEDVLKNLDKLNKNVRLLFKHGISVYSLDEIYRDRLCHNRGISNKYLEKIYPEKAYERESRRYFGKSTFDFAIDFSGYSLFWTKFLLAADANKKICFMHSDIVADSERTINGKRPHLINLRGLFSVYNRFNKLVSVSKGTMEVNRQNLKEYAQPEKFDYVMNSISPKKIIEGSQSKSYRSLTPEQNVETLSYESTKMISRAIIDDADKLSIWNNSLGDESTKEVALAIDYLNKEVLILWKIETEDGYLYKFSHDNKIIGWLNEKAFTLLPDSILEEINVNRLAILEKVKGNAIWNKPYRIYNSSRVSYSGTYKGMIVEVDKEAKTEHGIYSRIKLLGENLGWINSNALKIVEDYTDTNINSIELEKNKQKIIKKNHNIYNTVIEKFPERSLRHKNIKKVATIIDLTNYFILSALPNNQKSEKVKDTSDLIGKRVELTQMVITKSDVYYFVYFEGEKIGWINRKAIRISNSIEIFAEKDVKKKVEIDLSGEYQIYTRPFGMEDSRPVAKEQFSNSETFFVLKEVRTQNGEFSQINLEDKVVGWVNNEAIFNIAELGIKVGNTFIPEPDKKNINFVTMGRLSPEKAQGNLIEAFSKFNHCYSNSKLYIIGQGALYKELKNQINELNLENTVYLVGQLENPFKLLKQCDCFVLSSHYEGQPMVLLEALTLKLDVIATDIVANRSLLEEGKYGLLVEDKVEGLYDGMVAFKDKKNEKFGSEFDFENYSEEAINSFYEVLNSLKL